MRSDQRYEGREYIAKVPPIPWGFTLIGTLARGAAVTRHCTYGLAQAEFADRLPACSRRR